MAATAVSNKNRMEQLFSLGTFELLKRAFVLVSNQADILSAIHPVREKKEKGRECELTIIDRQEVSNAIESQSAEAVAEARSIEKLQEPLKLLRSFLRQRLWLFQKNYAQMIRSLPELIEPFATSPDLVTAMNQLTQVGYCLYLCKSQE